MEAQVANRLETAGSLDSTTHREFEGAGAELCAVLALRAGEIVRVRSEAEILATLDARGQLDGLPYMPEMRRFSGLEFRVHRRADKTCDTITGSLGARRLRDAVHLEGLRCNGADHGGCEAACLIFWKEAWLERTEPPALGILNGLARPLLDGGTQLPAAGAARCTRADVDRAALGPPEPTTGVPTWRCQITQLLEATEPLSPRDPVQYLRDWVGGNVSIGMLLKIGVLRTLARFVWGRGFRLKVRIYDAVARAFDQSPWPFHPGRGVGPAPREVLDLKPGDLVEVKSHAEILATLRGRNHRGLSFAPEMVRYCGGTYRVRARVEKILDEGSGRMLHMKNDCIVLEDVVCQSECSRGRLFCPRAIYPYWREIWLRRVVSADGLRATSARSTTEAE
jgi:hypothetical protein